MEFKTKLKHLEESKDFKDFKKDYPKAFLSHFFVMISHDSRDWQIGFYDEKSGKMANFIVNEEVKIESIQEPLKKPETQIKKLDYDKVDISIKNALNQVKSIQQEKYKEQKPVKIIAILQKINDKNVWNVTYISSALKTLNIRIDAENGDVVSEKLFSIIDKM